MDWLAFISNWLGSTPDFAVPYALAAIGLIIAERSGVLSLGAEGLMLVGALIAIGAQLSFGLVGLSLLAGMAAASLVSVMFAIMVVVLRVNQVIAGLALVFFCQGLTSLLGTLLGWTNKAVTGLEPFEISGLASIPVIGRLLFGQNLIVYFTVVVCIGATWMLYKTRLGMTLRAVGENPQAADSAGISVTGMRFWAVVLSAALVGLAGAYISLISSKLWVAGMTGGRGWIAIGLVIFARWAPWRALAGALLFGGIEALIPQLAAAGIRLPQYYVLMLPYLLTLAVMIWVALGMRKRKSGIDDEPAALGEPYVREERR